jgi:hypothetical protein
LGSYKEFFSKLTKNLIMIIAYLKNVIKLFTTVIYRHSTAIPPFSVIKLLLPWYLPWNGSKLPWKKV